jgi:hypothetical protein
MIILEQIYEKIEKTIIEKAMNSKIIIKRMKLKK